LQEGGLFTFALRSFPDVFGIMPLLSFVPEGAPPVAVRLHTELWKREPPRALQRNGGAWELELGELPVDRLEYSLELTWPDGATEYRLDPHAPKVEAPFAPRNVWLAESYRPPAWLSLDAPKGTVDPLELEAPSLGGPLSGLLWTAPGLAASTPAPLLIANDGPEYAKFASLIRFLETAVASHELTPLRAALLAPRARNEDYSASPLYAQALANAIPMLEQRVPTTKRVALGASLGALAMFHAHRQFPELFHAMVLQSGSFFQRELDTYEHNFSRFSRIDEFIRETSAKQGAPIEVQLTCGSAEENLANNRALEQVLRSQGYQVGFHTVRDGHTWTCWRDAWAESLGRVSVLRAVTPRSH
jgi:enterochelin esterase family protein